MIAKYSLSRFGRIVQFFTAALAITYFSCVKMLLAVEPVAAGGSNYAWYAIDESILNSGQDRNCRESFGIIANYHKPGIRNTVKGQLAKMYGNGQRALRIPIFHSINATSGTVLKSTGGDLTDQAKVNLTDFLADIKLAGYEEILVGFFPTSLSAPKNWFREFGSANTSDKTLYFNDVAFQQNWSVIQNVRPIIRNSGLAYKIDLSNEAAAASNQWVHQQYTKNLWILYNAAYGKSDTVGFSVATGSLAETRNPDKSVVGNLAANRYNTMKRIYDESGYGAPNIWDFHFYVDLELKFNKVEATMRAMGDSTDIIIGEAHYQDQATLDQIRNIETNRNILAVYAWPVTPERGCDGHVDVSFPEEYLYAPVSEATVSPPLPQPAESSIEIEPITSTGVGLALCRSAISDPDGDGYGWEDNRSCVVTTDVAQSSNITSTSNSMAICASADSDSDGDGYGWENNKSCVVVLNMHSSNQTTSTPICESADSDDDGDGYGWENNNSCLIAN